MLHTVHAGSLFSWNRFIFQDQVQRFGYGGTEKGEEKIVFFTLSPLLGSGVRLLLPATAAAVRQSSHKIKHAGNQQGSWLEWSINMYVIFM
jgi:hypothetical protein